MHAAIPFLLAALLTVSTLAADDSTAERWDARYSRAESFVYGSEPVRFLVEQMPVLARAKGRALCLAAGEGRNAVYLAQQGFDVIAVDISAVGMENCRGWAQQRGVEVETVVADLTTFDPGVEACDLITDFFYHQPDLFPKILAALKPGGHFILQNFSIDQLATGRFGPKTPPTWPNRMSCWPHSQATASDTMRGCSSRIERRHAKEIGSRRPLGCGEDRGGSCVFRMNVPQTSPSPS